MDLHRGRLIDHVQIVVTNLNASKDFYRAVFKVLNIPLGGETEDFFWYDEFCVTSKDSSAAAGRLTGRIHLAFQAESELMVDEFYKVGMANGGKDNGPPGKRSYHPGYYAAFLIDPDGNNIEAVFHGKASRSASSVKVSF